MYRISDDTQGILVSFSRVKELGKVLTAEISIENRISYLIFLSRVVEAFRSVSLQCINM